MRVMSIALAGAALAAMAGCSSGPNTPDEFRVVRKAPLTVPPEFNLRPPSPGDPRPQELSADAEVRVALFGRDMGADASRGEQLLIQAAGANAVNENVRSEIDFDTSQTLRKSRSFADKVINADGSEADPAAEGSPEAERQAEVKAEIDEVTGGGQVLVKRRGSSKLPGL